jgi:uncharacterized protein YvpB
MAVIFPFGLALIRATPPPPPHPSIALPPVTEAPPTDLLGLGIPLATTPPESALISDFKGHPQSLPLSCESRSAVDWAGYFGYSIRELDFLNDLPRSADPDVGFVGNVRGAWGQVPPNAYGVHAGPVERLLTARGVPAWFHLYTPWSTVQSEIASGRPVIVWVTGHVEPGHGQIYTAPGGHRTVVAPFEHTVILVGYTPDTVTVSDEGRQYRRLLTTFFESWAPLRNMSITTSP